LGVIQISLGEDRIYTDVTGVRQILKFYSECKKYTNRIIYITLDNMTWLDGNLCAFLGALLYRLNMDNKLTFQMNAGQVSDKFKILFANSFLAIDQNMQQYKSESCMPFKGFLPKQKDEFFDYLDNEVFSHPAMPKLSPEIKEQLIGDLGEIYANIDKHAETDEPFFVCGQYYPAKHSLLFTISDLGVGFFKKIHEKQPDKIDTCGSAILWAIAGNSTKPDAPGGSGLKNLRTYLDDNGGGMQVYTGDACWCSKTVKSVLYPDGINDLRNTYIGATINLEFNTKSLSFRKV